MSKETKIYTREAEAIGEANSRYKETDQNQYVVLVEGGYHVITYRGYWELFGKEPDETCLCKIEK